MYALNFTFHNYILPIYNIAGMNLIIQKNFYSKKTSFINADSAHFNTSLILKVLILRMAWCSITIGKKLHPHLSCMLSNMTWAYSKSCYLFNYTKNYFFVSQRHKSTSDLFLKWSIVYFLEHDFEWALWCRK